MAVEIVMPKWGLSMQEGLISQWLKREGEPVQQGEPVLEVETEKITNVVEAPASGVLARILYPAGSTIAVTLPIAIIAAPGEALPEIAAPAARAVGESMPTPAARTVGESAPAEIVRAMPIARKLAKEHNLDLVAVRGSGPGGAITKAD
ncbi:MAG: biotin/lipoyl-containing protein, partial [Roseiflexaceae bacterium]